MWQSSRPASFSPAGLTLWPSWLERWLATLSGLSVQVRIPVGLSVPGHYIGGSSTGLGKAQRIDSSLKADWLSCFSLAWWECQVTDRGVWCHWGREECDNPADLLASRQRVWPFGRVGWSAGSRLWVGYQSRFENQWGCRCRDITLGLIRTESMIRMICGIPCCRWPF